MAYIKQELAHLLYFFGYASNPDPEGEKNTTDYFTYEEPHPEAKHAYYGYKEANMRAK